MDCLWILCWVGRIVQFSVRKCSIFFVVFNSCLLVCYECFVQNGLFFNFINGLLLYF